MSEVRTTSSTGGQKGVKPERHDLIPVKGVAAIARVFAFGAEKYADHNWRLKYEWGKSLAALNRHIDAFADGETYDAESGLPHLAHAGFHILVLLTWLEEDGEGVDNVFDDRWPAAMERARLAKEAEESPNLMPFGIEWRDPAPMIARDLKPYQDAINKMIVGLGLARFSTDADGVTSDRESLAKRWVEDYDREIADLNAYHNR